MTSQETHDDRTPGSAPDGSSPAEDEAIDLLPVVSGVQAEEVASDAVSSDTVQAKEAESEFPAERKPALDGFLSRVAEIAGAPAKLSEVARDLAGNLAEQSDFAASDLDAFIAGIVSPALVSITDDSLTTEMRSAFEEQVRIAWQELAQATGGVSTDLAKIEERIAQVAVERISETHRRLWNDLLEQYRDAKVAFEAAGSPNSGEAVDNLIAAITEFNNNWETFAPFVANAQSHDPVVAPPPASNRAAPGRDPSGTSNTRTTARAETLESVYEALKATVDRTNQALAPNVKVTVTLDLQAHGDQQLPAQSGTGKVTIQNTRTGVVVDAPIKRPDGQSLIFYLKQIQKGVEQIPVAPSRAIATLDKFRSAAYSLDPRAAAQGKINLFTPSESTEAAPEYSAFINKSLPEGSSVTVTEDLTGLAGTPEEHRVCDAMSGASCFVLGVPGGERTNGQVDRIEVHADGGRSAWVVLSAPNGTVLVRDLGGPQLDAASVKSRVANLVGLFARNEIDLADINRSAGAAALLQMVPRVGSAEALAGSMSASRNIAVDNTATDLGGTAARPVHMIGQNRRDELVVNSTFKRVLMDGSDLGAAEYVDCKLQTVVVDSGSSEGLTLSGQNSEIDLILRAGSHRNLNVGSSRINRLGAEAGVDLSGLTCEGFPRLQALMAIVADSRRSLSETEHQELEQLKIQIIEQFENFYVEGLSAESRTYERSSTGVPGDVVDFLLNFEKVMGPVREGLVFEGMTAQETLAAWSEPSLFDQDPDVGIVGGGVTSVEGVIGGNRVLLEPVEGNRVRVTLVTVADSFVPAREEWQREKMSQGLLPENASRLLTLLRQGRGDAAQHLDWEREKGTNRPLQAVNVPERRSRLLNEETAPTLDDLLAEARATAETVKRSLQQSAIELEVNIDGAAAATLKLKNSTTSAQIEFRLDAPIESDQFARVEKLKQLLAKLGEVATFNEALGELVELDRAAELKSISDNKRAPRPLITQPPKTTELERSMAIAMDILADPRVGSRAVVSPATAVAASDSMQHLKERVARLFDGSQELRVSFPKRWRGGDCRFLELVVNGEAIILEGFKKGGDRLFSQRIELAGLASQELLAALTSGIKDHALTNRFRRSDLLGAVMRRVNTLLRTSPPVAA